MKILKWLLISVLSITLLIGLSYGAFHLIEFATGGKYVTFIKEHSETKPLAESFSFEILNDDVASSSLILVGEIHGLEEPVKFDLDFFKYLHDEHNINHYVAELDFVQAHLLNQYMQSGDDALLEKTLKKWVVVQGRNNLDYFNKYRAFHDYYQSQPDANKFEFIGIDKIQDIQLTASYISGLLPDSLSMPTVDSDLDSLLLQVDQLKDVFATSTDTLFILSHIKANLQATSEKSPREGVLFNNFYSLYKENQLQTKKVYGFFGLYHVLQYSVNGNLPLAAQIRTSDLNLENKMLSINFLINDSYMVMPSNQLPEFMRDAGKYTRMPISSDFLPILYVWGVKDFNRAIPANHKSIVKFNTADSPYEGSARLSKMYQIFPVTDLMEMNDKGKPYVQYTVFVRNSDWAEPMQ